MGVDPRSKTSPSFLLDRYSRIGLMDITIWQEQDIMPPHLLFSHLSVNNSNDEELKALYIERQIQFYTKCMAHLKYENRTWVTLTDTDEYVHVNNNAQSNYRLQHSKNMTIYDMLNDSLNRRGSLMTKRGCVSMHRLQFGHKESRPSAAQHMVPYGLNGTNFSTMRWRYHADRTDKMNNKLAKCMVDLKKARPDDFYSSKVNPHRPIKRLCDINDMNIRNLQSPFVVHHYTGSWEQWNFRNDFRHKRRRENFDKLYFDEGANQDDTIRQWLTDFVRSVGVDVALHLLQGAGSLAPF